jgi:hypothetical protein
MNKIIGALAFIAAYDGASAQQPPYAGSPPTMDSRPLWQQQLPDWQQQLPTRANPDRSAYDREPEFGRSQAESARRRRSYDNEQQRRYDEQMRIIRRPLNVW